MNKYRNLLSLTALCLSATLSPADEATAKEAPPLVVKKPKYPTTPAATKNPVILGVGMLLVGTAAAYFLFVRKGRDESAPQ